MVEKVEKGGGGGGGFSTGCRKEFLLDRVRIRVSFNLRLQFTGCSEGISLLDRVRIWINFSLG